ncbi:MAG: DUF1127 domain-containing protein [Hyphomicrobiaceae bacterium]|nr:MAG: DUF1127 domain-containing protein [Hyphomicrobiaceae bacterium]
MRHASSFLETTHSGPAATPSARILLAARSWWQRYRHKRRLKATILSLESLDDRTLKDIGLNRSEIESVVHTGGKDRLPKSRISISIARG